MRQCSVRCRLLRIGRRVRVDSADRPTPRQESRRHAGYAGAVTDPVNPKKSITPTRIAIWVMVAGVGLYMVISGLVTALANGS